MKPLIIGFFTLGLSMSHVLSFGIDSLKPASAQVFRCDDESLGEDKRQEVRGYDSRNESKVVLGSDCGNANFYEYVNEQNRRSDESFREMDKNWNERLRRQKESMNESMRESRIEACEFFGAHSRACTDEGFKQQAREEEERAIEAARIQQEQNAKIQQEQQRENELRHAVKSARSNIRGTQEQIAFWNARPDMQEQHKQLLPLYEEDLRRAEQELNDYLSQKARNDAGNFSVTEKEQALAVPRPPVVSPQESWSTASQLTILEGDSGQWRGNWSRLGNSNSFTVVQNNSQTGETVTFGADVYVNGNQISIVRPPSKGTYDCSYTGTLTGNTVSGTYYCNGYGPYQWSGNLQ
jgi:hypothetical protein